MKQIEAQRKELININREIFKNIGATASTEKYLIRIILSIFKMLTRINVTDTEQHSAKLLPAWR